MATQETLMPVFYIPHGGGPMPLLGEPNHAELIEFLQTVTAGVPTPKAILVISAHWESKAATISGAAFPSMIFDYYGFPPESYRFTYPAPGDPSLAKTIYDLLSAAGIAVNIDAARGYDHGTFVPLMLMYPRANIPVVQLSLLSSLAPADHIILGRSLASLREQGVLIVGSGMSFHNMQAFFADNPSTYSKSEQFDSWLTTLLTRQELSNDEREMGLAQWQSAPEARFCHPREEHLLPLHVCFGAASVKSASAKKVFSGSLFNTKISGFAWF